MCLPRRRRRKAPQQGAQAGVLQLALLLVEAMLQRLDAVEHEQHAALRHRLGDRLALGAGARCVTVMPSLSSAQLRNSSAEVARSFEPWL